MPRPLIVAVTAAGLAAGAVWQQAQRHKQRQRVQLDLSKAPALTDLCQPVLVEEQSFISVAKQPVVPETATGETKPPTRASFITLMLWLVLQLLTATAAYQFRDRGATKYICAVLAVITTWSLLGKREPVATPEVPAALQHAHRPIDFTGIWLKDKRLSDSMEESMNAMQLSRLMRMAVSLVKGIEIRQNSEDFEFAIISGILWFKVREKYPFSSEEQQYNRRDLRRGKHVGSLMVLRQGEICLRLRWGDPLGGQLTDVFLMPQPDVLHVYSSMTLNGSGKAVNTRAVYRRKA